MSTAPDSVDAELLAELMAADDAELERIISTMSHADVEALAGALGNNEETVMPPTPVAQAQELDESFIPRDHLVYLSDRIAQAVADVEAGHDRKLIVSMPPRHGKSHLGSTYAPLWLLRKHPDWKLMLVSHSPNLAASWGRAIRRKVEDRGALLGLQIAPDAKAVTEWETTRGGVVVSRSVGQALAGLGAKVLIIDDAVKDADAAASKLYRDSLWQWWQMDASTRLEPPSLVIVIGTRWHEDDFIGRLTSAEHSPDTRADWEQIVLPAIAHKDGDVLGRAPGEPLLSPIVKDDTPEKALARFASLKRTSGSYGWAALFDQSPAPAQGAIFSVDWWRYWTLDPALVDETHRLLDLEQLAGARHIDSWDATFKDTKSSDFVVGQRWARVGANRYLLHQVRDRMSFTATIDAMKAFMKAGIGHSNTHQHLIEDKANGPAIIDSLRDAISGLKPVNPRGSKEARARAVTPEVESGNVYLPDPRMPGFEWVRELVEEARMFPTGAHDDQVDAMTQALDELREQGVGSISVPGARTGAPSAAADRVRRALASRSVQLSRAGAAKTDGAHRRAQ